MPPSFAAVYALFAGSLSLSSAGIAPSRLIHGEQQFTWTRALRVGETVTSQGQIADVYRKRNLQFVTAEAVVKDEAGEEVCRSRSTILVLPYPKATAENGALTQSSTQLTVGQEVLSLSVTHSKEQIKAYADASGDQNPIHQDDEIARSVGLPGVIAHGMLNYGLLSRAVTDWLGDPRRMRRLSVRFSAMVQPGDTVTCKGTVASIGRIWRGQQPINVWMENQRGEKACSATRRRKSHTKRAPRP